MVCFHFLNSNKINEVLSIKILAEIFKNIQGIFKNFARSFFSTFFKFQDFPR